MKYLTEKNTMNGSCMGVDTEVCSLDRAITSDAVVETADDASEVQLRMHQTITPEDLLTKCS